MSRTPGTARPQAILGIDLGTTEVKAGLVTLDGRLLALARSGYALDVGRHPGWAEQDPGAWWSAVVSAVRALRVTDVAEVVAIGVDGHGPTLVAVDGRGEATRPAITWMDTRSIAEADELAEATGVRGWALAGLPAALWVERHDRAAADATRWYLATWEWLAFRLTGEAVAPLTPNQLVPDRALVTAAGIPADRLPEVGATGSLVGHLTGAAADALGPERRDPGRGRHGGRLRELPRRRAPPGRRRVRPGRIGGRLRRLLGPTRGGARRVRHACTAGRALQRRRGDGGHRPGPRLVPRRRPRRHDRHRCAPGRGGATPRPAPTASSSCRISPANGRRSGIRRPAACSPG